MKFIVAFCGLCLLAQSAPAGIIPLPTRIIQHRWEYSTLTGIQTDEEYKPKIIVTKLSIEKVVSGGDTNIVFSPLPIPGERDTSDEIRATVPYSDRTNMVAALRRGLVAMEKAKTKRANVDESLYESGEVKLSVLSTDNARKVSIELYLTDSVTYALQKLDAEKLCAMLKGL